MIHPARATGSGLLIACAVLPLLGGPLAFTARSDDTAPSASSSTPASGAPDALHGGRAAGAITLPPGVDAAALTERGDDGTNATATLAEAIEALGAAWPLPPVTLPEPVGDPDEGMRAYSRAIDAAEEGRWLIAVTELEKAKAALPSAPEVARRLAHAYLQVGSTARATDELLRAAALAPNDERLLVDAAAALLGRRQPVVAASILARAVNQAGGLEALRKELGPEYGVAAPTALGEALRDAGWDAAFVDAAVAALDQLDSIDGATIAGNPRLGILHRRRAESWRAIGDALCRLGRFDEAVSAYERAATLPSADPAALRPRQAWALVRAGRGNEAVDAFINAVTTNVDSVRDADAALAGWLFDVVDDPAPLQQALQALAKAHPGSGVVLRMAVAQLPPEAAADLIEAHLARGAGSTRGDTNTVGRLLQLLAAHDLRRSLSVGARLVEAQPQRVGDIVTWLYQVPATAAEALDAARAVPESPGQSAILTALLLHLDQLPEAWNETKHAAERWPGDPLVFVSRLAAARQLREPALVERDIDEARSEALIPADLAVTASAVVAAWETQLDERAASLARELADAHPDAALAHAILAQSFLRETMNPSFPDDQRLKAAAAIIESAERAIDLDPATPSAWSILASVYEPDGLMPDPAKRRAVIDRLAVVAPNSPLAALHTTGADLSAGRLGAVIERARELAEIPEAEQSAIDMLITALAREGRLDEADAWLRARVDATPLASPPLGSLVILLQQTGRVDEAEALLKERLAAHPADRRPTRLLEDLWRRTGRAELACTSGRQRLAAYPEGVRRSLQLAALDIECGDDRTAMATLRTLTEDPDALPAPQLLEAILLAQRLDAFTRGRDEFVLAMCDRYAAKQADVPMQVTTARALASTRLGRPDTESLEVIGRAMWTSEGGDSSLEGADHWILLASVLSDAYRPDLGAEALRRRVLDGPPLHADAQLRLATAAMAIDASSGDADSSIAFMRRLLERLGPWPPAATMTGVSTDESRALLWLSTIHALVGEDRGAAKVLEEVIRIDPESAMAKNNLGYALLTRGRLDAEVVDLIESAHRAAPDEPSILDSLGWLRYLQGRLDDEPVAGASPLPGAITLLRRAVERSPEPSAEVLDHLGDALWRAGRREEAGMTWTAAYEAAARYPRDRMVEVLAAYQQRELGLVVRDPEEVYQRQFGKTLEGITRKLEQLRGGLEPSVAPVPGGDSASSASPTNPRSTRNRAIADRSGVDSLFELDEAGKPSALVFQVWSQHGRP